jgi:hypothetical protein
MTASASRVGSAGPLAGRKLGSTAIPKTAAFGLAAIDTNASDPC